MPLAAIDRSLPHPAQPDDPQKKTAAHADYKPAHAEIDEAAERAQRDRPGDSAWQRRGADRDFVDRLRQ